MAFGQSLCHLTSCAPPQPPFSLLKFLVPVGAAPQALVLEPTDDTTLRAGAYQKASLTGGEPTLTVATSATNTQVNRLVGVPNPHVS